MRVAFSWHGLPQYAARQLAAAIRNIGFPCSVIGSKPLVPVEGVDEILGNHVLWVDSGQRYSWSRLGLSVPDVFFQSGWAYPAFNSLGDEVRANGGKVCLMMDNNWRGDLRQLIGATWFRLCQRHKFSAVLVPGRSGRRLARWYGVSNDRIWEGMYGADPEIFFDGQPLADRPKKIIFVGQYIERKQCILLSKAFAEVADRLPGWELDMYGSGSQQELISCHPRIRVHGFIQPERLGVLYREARIFALPSLREAWGLVVHEAALSGCQLLLSDAIGARDDFAGRYNSALFCAGDFGSLKDALMRLASQDNETLVAAQAESIRVAQSHGPKVFAKRALEIVDKLAYSSRGS